MLAFTSADRVECPHLLFGLVPVFHASKIDLIPLQALKQAGARALLVSGRPEFHRTRGMLVVSEVALAVVLLAGAGLLMKSLMALTASRWGFSQPTRS